MTYIQGLFCLVHWQALDFTCCVYTLPDGFNSFGGKHHCRGQLANFISFIKIQGLVTIKYLFTIKRMASLS